MPEPQPAADARSAAEARPEAEVRPGAERLGGIFATGGVALSNGLRLERLRAGHAEALLAFELENREYFAKSIPDRGDAYFAEFAARHEALLAEQETGTIQFHLVLDGDQVVGRVNLIDLAAGSADLGYRIAEKAAGRGVASAAVKVMLELAATEYGLTSIRAATTVGNKASQAVLSRAGFVRTGEVMLSEELGISYTRQLTA